MKSKLYLVGTILLLVAALVIFFPKEQTAKPLAKEQQIKKKNKEREDLPAAYIEARMKYEYDMLKDPRTGEIPEGIFAKERALAKTLPVRSNISPNGRTSALNTYLPAGPNNIGGRTRGLAYDVRYNGTTNRVIIAGSVSGGIMRSADGGQTWMLVTPSENIHSFTALVQDTREGFQNIWYAGSGEFSGNSASEVGAPYLGFGLWKSVDNGLTWTKLTVTISNISALNNPIDFDHPFDFTYNIAVNPVNGDVYVAAWVILIKSTDGGNTFRAVFQSASSANTATGQMHVTVNNNGRIFLAVNGGADAAKRGVWYSDAGNLNTWTRIAGGQTPGADSISNWRGNSYDGSSKRILLTLAPSNQNIGYVFYENGLSSDPPQLQPEADLFRFDMAGSSFTWSNRSANMPDIAGGNLAGSDPINVQGGYNMEIRVKPDNPDVVFVGGTNLYRSTDGFSSNANTTWIGGYNTNFTYNQYPNSHADIHRLVFNPSNANEATCGNDGGIQVTNNIMDATVSWQMYPNYQTLQYYNVAIDPTPGRNNFAGGAQDNGVRFRDRSGIFGTPPADSNNHRLLFSADGATVAISTETSGAQFLYESIQNGELRRVRLTAPQSTSPNISPIGLTTGPGGGFGEFVTNFRLVADNTEDLYYVNYNRLFRTTTASTVTSTSGWTEMTGVTQTVNQADPSGRGIAIRGTANSRGPYMSSHALYLGTTNGKIYRLDDPRNASPGTVPINITPAGLTGNVQDISVNPNNDDEVLAIVSNYNVVSIWWTTNGKSASPTWINAEGNLTLPSIRSCAIVVKKDASNSPVTEYYVGTSIGLYSTTNLGGGNPTWQREGGNLLNYAVVQSLAYRPTDNVLLVGTHGNGMYFTYLGTPNYTPNLNTGINPITNDRRFIDAVYPTIAGNIVHYRIGNLGIRKILITVTSMSGQTIVKKETGYQTGSISIGTLPAGQYILTIFSDDNKYRHVQKFIKQ
jgi:hypothetical protein